ncbi:helix-turn-helix domain-containing protein [Sorangium sp. So ce764]|uniref:helix-turn-helix domain-containing protein n=1 Tax=unclassified Sorangium TaxID=2621164 RepID=UPI003F5E52BC
MEDDARLRRALGEAPRGARRRGRRLRVDGRGVSRARGRGVSRDHRRRTSIQVEEQVRTILVDEALARAGGSRRKAAQLLNISRQLLQHSLRRRS